MPFNPNFVGPSYNLDDHPHSVQRTINLVPVPNEAGNERAGIVFKDAPGLEEFTTLGDGGECVALLTEHFTATDGALLTDLTPSAVPAGFAWHSFGSDDVHVIESNAAKAPGAGATTQLYSYNGIDYDQLGLALPFRLTFVATNFYHSGNGAYVNIDGPDNGLGTTTRILVSIRRLAGLTDSVWVRVFPDFINEGPTEYEAAVSDDTEHTVQVTFYGDRFAVSIDGGAAVETMLDGVLHSPTDGTFLLIQTGDEQSIISNPLAVCLL